MNMMEKPIRPVYAVITPSNFVFAASMIGGRLEMNLKSTLSEYSFREDSFRKNNCNEFPMI